jgi:hypothetical protein
MFYGILHKIHYGITFKSCETSETEIALVMFNPNMSDGSIELERKTENVAVVTAITD